MAEIEKMSIEEIGKRVEEVEVVLCETFDKLKPDAIGENIAQEELNAIIVGAISTLNYVHGTYLGGFDDAEPDMVPVMRVFPSEKTASIIIGSAVDAYRELFAEEGDEQ